MNEFNLIATFTGSLITALIFGFIATRIHLSPIVGYLIAGIAVGPFTPGFIADRTIAKQLADIGVVLLMFGIGIKFNLKELLNVWKIAIPGAIIQSTLSTILLALLLRFFGWSWTSGIVLGLSISVASTVVMATVLSSHFDLNTQIGYIAIGWTVVEDIITVLLLLAFPMIFKASGSNSYSSVFMVAVYKIFSLFVIIFLLGKWVIPFILEKIAITRSSELFTLSVLALALGVGFGTSHFFGISIELGAFLAGLAVGRSEFAARAAADAMPMRDAFAVIFFVSIGMLFDIRSIILYPGITIVTLLVIIIGKPLIATLTARVLGKDFSIAIPVGAAFSQVGEFSFILGSLALNLGVLSNEGWNAIIAASIISMALNPAIYSIARRYRFSHLKSVSQEKSAIVDPQKYILVGYGPVGQTVYSILKNHGAKIKIIELNFETVKRLKREDYDIIYGDALKPGVLEEAGVNDAAGLIVTTDIEYSDEIVRRVKSINPAISVIVRCDHLKEVESLKKAGADVVACGEVEVAVAIAESLEGSQNTLSMSTQRDGIRASLYGYPPNN
ncbi:MAG: sodium:proton exchanger [Elusimicrobia bacterium]|nr:sodium:proton exchanger [Elusimicrobiota bacterium]